MLSSPLAAERLHTLPPYHKQMVIAQQLVRVSRTHPRRHRHNNNGITAVVQRVTNPLSVRSLYATNQRALFVKRIFLKGPEERCATTGPSSHFMRLMSFRARCCTLLPDLRAVDNTGRSTTAHLRFARAFAAAGSQRYRPGAAAARYQSATIITATAATAGQYQKISNIAVFRPFPPRHSSIHPDNLLFLSVLPGWRRLCRVREHEDYASFLGILE